MNFLQPDVRKKGSFFLGAPPSLSGNGFRQGTKAACRSSTTIQRDVCAFFGANTQVAILNELLATRRMKGGSIAWRPSIHPPLRKRLSSRDESCLSMKQHDSTGRVCLLRCEHTGCNFKRTSCNQADERRVCCLAPP